MTDSMVLWPAKPRIFTTYPFMESSLSPGLTMVLTRLILSFCFLLRSQ